MPEPILLLLGLGLAGVVVLLPLRRAAPGEVAGDAEDEAAVLRHRVALEALRDVETDRRAGSLDDATYAAQRAEAEARAADTRSDLDRRVSDPPSSARGGRTVAAVGAGVIAIVLLAGSLYPATGIANRTVLNEPLAAARSAEDQRQARIADLQAALAEDPEDPDPATVSDLADAYLAGTSDEDLARAAAALQLLIALEPDRADAYERILAAYLRAGSYRDARAALESYARRSTADPAEVAFFDGLIALRGERDPGAAVEAFDRFLELASDDPRVPMVRGLRDEAAGG